MVSRRRKAERELPVLKSTKSMWQLNWGTDAALEQAHEHHGPPPELHEEEEEGGDSGDESHGEPDLDDEAPLPPRSPQSPRRTRRNQPRGGGGLAAGGAAYDEAEVVCNFPDCTDPGSDGFSLCPGCNDRKHHHFCAIRWGQEALSSKCYACWDGEVE